ncbi:MAG: class I SAM-dependent methyltransferase [Candidatus Eiseniibacteriota bacterium]
MAEQIELNDVLYDYLKSVSLREPEVLARLRAETAKLRYNFFQVSAVEGQFLALLVKLTGTKRILEVGVFTGYSSTAMALALPKDGRLIALDIDKDWTAIAQRYWKEAGVADKIELRLAPAKDSMDALIESGQAGTFDLVFIDADKPGYPDYYERALTLLRKGGLIIVDNTLFGARVVGQNLEGLEAWQIEWIEHVRKFNNKLHRDERVTLSMIPVGDGMTLALKH